MRILLFWISSAVVAAGWLYLTSKAGWGGLVAGISITIWTMVSMGCLLGGKKK